MFERSDKRVCVCWLRGRTLVGILIATSLESCKSARCSIRRSSVRRTCLLLLWPDGLVSALKIRDRTLGPEMY